MGLNKFIVGGFVFVSLLFVFGEAITCFECPDEKACIDVDNSTTATCEGAWCFGMETADAWTRGCTVDNTYCDPHLGMSHDCYVCDWDGCNGATAISSSLALATAAAILFKAIY